MSLKDHFKPFGHVQSLRANQIDALSQTEALFSFSIRSIEIEAPPGSGKSVLVDTLMNYFNSLGMKCIVTSPQNSQVMQYAESGFGMATLMGREHYKCIAGKENCSKGFCTLKKCPDGKLIRDCQAQDYSSCFNCTCVKCNYKKAFKIFRNSDKANTNFTLFLMGIDNKPQVIFIDEADTIESSIRDFNSIVIPELFPHYRFPEIIPDLFGFIDRSVKEIEDIKTKRAAEKKEITETEEKRINYLEDLCGRILLITKDFESHKEPWCITQKTESKKTKIEPVTIERFLKNILRNRIVFMLSATPPHYPGFERVRVESSFPIATRQWIYDPFPGSLVKSQREASIPRAAVWLSSLQGKTLVHCYDSLTRVLTLDGLKYFQNLRPSDHIATLNVMGEVEYQKPISIINYKYDGEMISFKNSRLDLLVTPDHRMYVSSLRGDKEFGYSFKTARELRDGIQLNGFKRARSFKLMKTAKWSGKEVSVWSIPHVVYEPNCTVEKYHNKGPHDIPIKLWMRFLGWYISEGYSIYDIERSQYQVNISQKDIEKTELPQLIKDMGYVGYIRKASSDPNKGQQIDHLIITDKSLAGYMINNFGKDCYTKHLPKSILELSSELLDEFIDTYCEGDGTKRKHYKQMSTSSRILKDNLIEIGLKTGHQTNVEYISPEKRAKYPQSFSTSRDLWVIGFSHKNRHACVKPDEIDSNMYNGHVGCVEVPNSIIFVERNGKSVWCGNCKSYKTAEMLHQKLRIIKRSSLLQVNKNDDSNEENRYSRYDAVKAFLASRNPDEILISVNQGRGLNLHQPEVINNVVLVVPWQNPKDPLTILKTQILGEAWKKQEVANEVAQAIARHFRNEKMGIYMGKEVPKRAYIIDASWGRWYNVNKGLFPKNFTESERL